MKKSNLVTFSFPSLMMILMSVISFTDILSFSDIDLKGLFIISLVLFFPILFIAQGIACALTKSNVFTALIISNLTYLVIMFIFLNDSAMGYILYYSIAYFIGYFLSKLILKLKSKNNAHILKFLIAILITSLIVFLLIYLYSLLVIS